MGISLETPPQNSSQLKREALIFAGGVWFPGGWDIKSSRKIKIDIKRSLLITVYRMNAAWENVGKQDTIDIHIPVAAAVIVSACPYSLMC